MRSRASLAALCVVAACGTSAGTVDIVAITPAAGTPDTAIAVQLEGDFTLDLTSNLDTGTHGLASVEVRIGDVALADVVWVDDRRIDGMLPAGLAPGQHDVVVQIGARRGTLVDGFAITNAQLVSTLSIPTVIGRDSDFAVTMDVTNNGSGPATALASAPLVVSGSASAALVTDAIGGASLAPGASATLTWTYRASTVGTLVFMGNAVATDEDTGAPIASAVTASNMADVFEVTTIIGDPLGDGSPFGYVVGYAGNVYVGPNQTGSTLAKLAPDGTLLADDIAFTFAADTTGNQAANAGLGSLKSIGYTGCAVNTLACGPDNEDGRGYLAAGTLGGTEWLVLGGAKPTQQLRYLYMTSDTDSTLDFRYVDLSAYLGPQTHGFSAAHFLNDRLYLGFPDSGGSRPYLLALQVAPPAPGLDASGADVIDLNGRDVPGFNAPNPAMIDAFGDLNGLLYIGSQGGLYAATTTAPGPFMAPSGDWANATPAFTAWTTKPAHATNKLVDLFPADRAIAQIAAFGGRLFVGRNTTSGPQLWACNPALSTSPTRCEPGDWQHAAPNITGDPQLTQFNNPALTAITMVVATPQWLYVGFDSPDGVQVFRTSDPASLLPVNFEGLAGCRANMHPGTCEGIGGTGLGDPSDTRILDARAVTVNGVSRVWITVGDASGAIRLVMIP